MLDQFFNRNRWFYLNCLSSHVFVVSFCGFSATSAHGLAKLANLFHDANVLQLSQQAEVLCERVVVAPNKLRSSTTREPGCKKDSATDQLLS